ncbi:MAG: SUMF1/EgtB/PvdO family nonheme iron enzyme [Phycisphaerae bacterium]|nr:SUMF1/EgtB/PvdO family nonheme iron enzyme [Phycisphaerae bacterium]
MPFLRCWLVLVALVVLGATAMPASASWSSDFDGDNDVDLADFSTFAACFNGPNRPTAVFCAVDADLDSDGDVDLADFAIFAACFNGPNRPPACEPDVPSGMVRIPAGEFQMGDTFSERDTDELPVHAVWVSAFYMDRYEVTKQLWDTVRAWGLSNGYYDLTTGGGKAADHPVQAVNWYDCVKWANARSQKEGRTPCYYTDAGLTVVYMTGELTGLFQPHVKWDANGYRLPTEAEWEKAARGGAAGERFPHGDLINHDHANYTANGSAYVYDTSPYTTWTYHPTFAVGNTPYTSPVGFFAPNGYGLYDMPGNVWEWCNDWYGSTYYSSSPYDNPTGPATGSSRVLRGGSWNYYANSCRVADRNHLHPDSLGSYGGVRVVCSVGGVD